MVTLDQAGRLGSDIRLWRTGPDLDAWIEHLFVLDFRHVRETAWRVLPDPSAHVIVHVVGGPACSESGQPLLVGARNTAIDVDVRARRWTIGARFRPGALASLAGIPAGALTDGRATPGALFGARGDAFAAEVRGAPEASFVLDRLAALLRDVSRGRSEPDWRATSFDALVRRSGGSITIADAARTMGVSVRSLRAHAHESIGLAPKRHARIRRVFGVLGRALAARPDGRVSWGRIASRSGYADQPHLVRDFRDLVGETPAAFLRRGADVPIRSRPDPEPDAC